MAEFQVKSNLAKLLATENIQIRHQPSATTAGFDVKNRLLILPVWKGISNYLYDMLVVHEVGHALDTPPEAWAHGIKRIVNKHYKQENNAALAAAKDFLNVVEDARIDKRQKRRYPGSKPDYVHGHKELFDRDFFGIKNKDVNALSFIDRANIYYKGGITLNIKFSDQEKKYIERMGNTETFDEVVDLTEEIFDYAKNVENNLDVQKSLEFGEGEGSESDEETLEIEMDIEDFEKAFGNPADMDGDEDDEGDEGSAKVKIKITDKNNPGKDGKKSDSDGDDDKGDEESTEKASEKNASKTNKTPENKNKEDKGKKTKIKVTLNDIGGPGDDNFVPVSETQRAAEKNTKDIVMNDNVDYIYLKLPKFNNDVIIEDFKDVLPRMEGALNSSKKGNEKDYNNHIENLTNWKRQEKDTITYMVKEFEMRKSADAYSRQSIAKTGVINTNKLHSYIFNDDIFKRNTVIPTGKNHGFCMLLDWSGSMDTNLVGTLKQLFSLVMFCRQVQIPFEVYFFRTWNWNDPGNRTAGGDLCTTNSQNTIMFSDFKLCNILSSRMTASQLQRAMNVLWASVFYSVGRDNRNGTPLNQALLVFSDIVNAFHKKNHLQIVTTIVMTDGGSDTCNGYFGQNRAVYQRREKHIIVDDVTKQTYYMQGSILSTPAEITKIFVEILKARTHSHVIGFYIHSGYLSSVPTAVFDPTLANKSETKKCWSENRFAVSKSAGYDENYVIDVNSLAKKQDDLKFDNTMSKSAQVKEAVKHFSKKQINRVLLSRFIEKISSEAKNVKKAS